MLKVLVVDDAMFMRRLLSDLLKKCGCEVVGEACDGFEGVKAFKALKPDFVTLDITMPDMDGLTALKEIKKIDHNAIVAMCSAMGQQSMQDDAMEHGAIGFIIKPFKENNIKEIVEKAEMIYGTSRK